ncbi:NERD domain-containing protein [Mesobacillus subterraneus]|nr:NERD domain-containing protein [Mesobacillus subterraneus]
MIVKRRIFPLRIKINDAIQRRLPVNHPKLPEVLQDSMKIRAGHKGEEALDYYTSLLHEDEFHIFQGLRLKTGQSHFQIDSLLLSPSFALIIDSKNMAGILTFHSHFNQMERTFNDKTDIYEDPILQVKRHRLLLIKWLKDHSFPQIPIEYLVFSSNPATALRNPSNDQEVYQRVCPPGKIIFKIEEFISRYKKELLSIKEFKRLSKLLLKSDIPAGSHLHQFKIDSSEYLTGVQCPSCSKYAMEWYSGTWNCPLCRRTAKNAHNQALGDYFLLINDTITNQQLRKFLHIHSPKLATKLLSKSNLKCHESTRRSCYYTPH